MAHESCGAVKAAFATLNGNDAGSPALNALVKDIHPRIKSFKSETPSEKKENTDNRRNAKSILDLYKLN